MLVRGAVDDLARLAHSGAHLRLLKKLVEIVGDDEIGRPLGRGPTGWRRCAVGDRAWLIVYRTTEGVAVVVSESLLEIIEITASHSRRRRKGQ